MIKTCDQFIEEGLFSKKNKSVKLINFAEQYKDMAWDCLTNIVEFVMGNGGEVEVKPTDVLIYAGDKPNFKNGAVIAKITGVKCRKAEDDDVYIFDNYAISMTLENEKELPIDDELVPFDTFFAVNAILNA
jgi:hypothetical protein